MTSTSTLTSLAILSVYVNQDSNYLEYLNPFILHVLIEERPDPVKSDVVSRHLRDHFGLEIPYQTVETVLKRMARHNVIGRQNYVYRITGELPDPGITAKADGVKRQIDSVVSALLEYSQNGIKPFASTEHAVAAICSFLSSFDVTCLRAALQETAIPSIGRTHKTDIVQVSEFVQHLQRSSPVLFHNFLVLLQGNMLANALLCPDLHDAPPTFENVDFYFDTPLLIPLLGLEDDSRLSAMRELIVLLAKLGGKAFAFSHTLRELQRVIASAANKLNSPDGRGRIIREARERGTGKAELVRIADKLEEELAGLAVDIEDTPQHIVDLQIDESAFEDVLKDEVSYSNNPNAILHDINSVRSIYAIRGQKPALSLENASAVLVTSNNAFANAAWRYGQQHESSRDVSVVITEFSLANLAWLKAPMNAPDIPKTQLLAFSFAALMPSRKLLDKFMTEIDRLESSGSIAARDHQLLRSSQLVNSELMHLTLGEDTALTSETVMQTLKRVTGEIRKEETAKIVKEEEAHRATQASLSTQVTQNKAMREIICRRCFRIANIIAWTVTSTLGAVFLAGLYQEIGMNSPLSTEGRIVIAFFAVYVAVPVGNLFFNFTFLNFHRKLQNGLFTRLLQRESQALGVQVSDFDCE